MAGNDEAKDELLTLLEQAFFEGNAGTGLECAIEATAAILANPRAVVDAFGGFEALVKATGGEYVATGEGFEAWWTHD